jgi:hypothetical protein
MFDSFYEVSKVSVSRSLPNEDHICQTLYRFDTSAGERYLIFVTEYPELFHTIDFCRRSQRYARRQFTELTGQRDAIRIISMVVKLMVDLLENGYDDRVNFGFIGARTEQEDAGKVSKRFRIYRIIRQNLVDRIKYYHLEDESTDAYVILKANVNPVQVLRAARQAFDKEEEYPPHT